MSNVELTKEQKRLLQTARETYGNKNQILVCMEELNELSCVLAKYPRYDDSKEAIEELQERILDEVADVYIILEHVKSIAELNEPMIEERIKRKLERMNRWLNTSESIEETVKDRAVRTDLCVGCIFQNVMNEPEVYDNHCKSCLAAQGYDGTTPYKQTIV